MPPAFDFVGQAYVRAVATSRVGFVVIAENVEIFPLVAERPTPTPSNDPKAAVGTCRAQFRADICCLCATEITAYLDNKGALA